jgi:hypothetical protein
MQTCLRVPAIAVSLAAALLGAAAIALGRRLEPTPCPDPAWLAHVEEVF